MLTQSIEDYLKAIYKLEALGKVSVSDISAELSVAPSSVTKMVHRLVTLDLVSHNSHKEVKLTEHGHKAALNVLRRHRLLETFLVEVMQYTWDEVHEEACNLEHFISKKFEDKIADMLGNPEFDPHGDPIPNKYGEIAELNDIRLTSIDSNIAVTVTRVEKDKQDLLIYLADLGITPLKKMQVLGQDKFGGSIKLNIGGVMQQIGPEAAKYVYVSIDD